MSRFHLYSNSSNPGLHIWREGTDTKLFLNPVVAAGNDGWFEFDYDFEPSILQAIRFMLFEFVAGKPDKFEDSFFQRTLPRQPDGTLVDDVWFVQGTQRTLTEDPLTQAIDRVRVHVISQSRLRPSRLYLWDAATGQSKRFDAAGEDADGPFFDLTLHGQEKSFFNLKFIGRDQEGGFSVFEPDFANRLWTARDGAEIWTHSMGGEMVSRRPQKKTMRVNFKQAQPAGPAWRMRFWQINSDFTEDAPSSGANDGWTEHEAELFTDMKYRIKFWNPGGPANAAWENAEAEREIRITEDTEFWTLEGDRQMFPAKPARDQAVTLQLALTPPGCALRGALFGHIWINRASAPLEAAVAISPTGQLSFTTYPDVVVSLRLFDENNHWEATARHTLQIPVGAAGTYARFLVPDRATLLEERPPTDIFQDPPFEIKRPGAYEQDGALHFIIHAPHATRVRLVGDWTDGTNEAVEMHSTIDGAYWWARVPVAEVLADLGAADYHGAKYQFLFNDSERFQDPAAGWMESTWNQGWSRLVQTDKFVWGDTTWQRPGWDHLTIYQLHVARFSNRFPAEAPLRRVAREIDDAGGYLRDLGITAILILPVNEVGSTNSWGYDPAFFYGIENDAGGPDAMKELVDVCHRHGLAVLVDVVFNHAGSTDNILWSISQSSYFDGDTRWGALINFDHPQCRHFFSQNLVYLAQEFHIDGFRLDHTSTIVHSNVWDRWSGFVTVRGSGGGWEFLHAIRAALHRDVEARCLLMAEHLPNEWAMTNFGGPMDTQWCDDFHDRMVDACRRQFGMSRLADAFQLSHTACDNWYKVTNYPESHDEVGNVRDRIAFVAGWGQGFRMSKVAAAGTLLSRGIPMYFMGAESAEDQQFAFGSSATLDLDGYLASEDRGRVRYWWRILAELRGNPSIKGPSPLKVCLAEEQLLAFTRGDRGDFFVLLNFGGWTGYRELAQLGLPEGSYRELWNSTWPAFAVPAEYEGEHGNGGRDARLSRGNWLHIPDYGAVVLERVD